MAELCVAKYVDHLPFYRQAKRFERDHGWIVHKSTINDWLVSFAAAFGGDCFIMEERVG
ncbi:MAG: transposase [Bacteroidota bacterium]